MKKQKQETEGQTTGNSSTKVTDDQQASIVPYMYYSGMPGAYHSGNGHFILLQPRIVNQAMPNENSWVHTGYNPTMLLATPCASFMRPCFVNPQAFGLYTHGDYTIDTSNYFAPLQNS